MLGYPERSIAKKKKHATFFPPQITFCFAYKCDEKKTVLNFKTNMPHVLAYRPQGDLIFYDPCTKGSIVKVP